MDALNIGREVHFNGSSAQVFSDRELMGEIDLKNLMRSEQLKALAVENWSRTMH
jgi:hypothetical protein